MTDKQITVKCACHSLAHAIELVQFDDESVVYLTAIAAPSHYGFFRRIWHGLRFMFNRMSAPTVELVLRPDAIQAIHEFTAPQKLKGQTSEGNLSR